MPRSYTATAFAADHSDRCTGALVLNSMLEHPCISPPHADVVMFQCWPNAANTEGRGVRKSTAATPAAVYSALFKLAVPNPTQITQRSCDAASQANALL